MLVAWIFSYRNFSASPAAVIQLKRLHQGVKLSDEFYTYDSKYFIIVDNISFKLAGRTLIRSDGP